MGSALEIRKLFYSETENGDTATYLPNRPELWTQEMFSVQDGTPFVQTSLEPEAVPILERKDEFLRAFWEEAVAMGNPITECTSGSILFFFFFYKIDVYNFG